jgi:CDP-diacylglycerol--inositol 3-phosphatidyltransferase
MPIYLVIPFLLVTGSKFGGVLDMVTDRVSTCGLLVILAQFYPEYSFWFIFLIVLDITSHWFHVMRYAATALTPY